MFIGKSLILNFLIVVVFSTRWVVSNEFAYHAPYTPVYPDFSVDRIQTGFVKYPLFKFNPYSSEQHPCDRICSFDKSFICYYQMILEDYESYNAEACRPECVNSPLFYKCPGCILTDGVKTPLRSINRQMPGPYITVCKNDLLIIDVQNSMTEGTSIHWHGIDQSQTPYMDGMPSVTQAEIPPGSMYRYKFIASNHGTNFYHSHSYWQRGQGIYGTLTVRLPPQVNPLWFAYDLDLKEHCIVLSDWGYNFQRVANNFLIHGKGWSSYSQGTYRGAPNVFFVRPGIRYRFRLIYNGVINVPLEFSIEGHSVYVIASDGNEIKPEYVSSIAMNTGERFDFVLNAHQSTGNYWIKVCNPLNRTLSQFAILSYENAPMKNPPTPPDVSQRPPGIQVNEHNVGPGTPGAITVSELEGFTEVPWKYQNVHWTKTFHEIGVNLTVLNFEIDKISMIMPQIPLLIEKDRIDDRTFCNRSTLTRQGIDCSQTICKCTHVIQYDLCSYVEMIFFATSLHPVHLHGYLFFVVGMGVVTQPMTRNLIIEMDRRGEIVRNRDQPILKDTVAVPRNGYVVIQFQACNAGYWFLHCHIEFHAVLGMTAVMQVGQPNQMLSLPRTYRPYPF